MADKPLTTSPMYPGVEYVRVRQEGAEFTTAKSSVTKDMTVLKDVDAISRISGLPLEPTAVSPSTAKKTTAKRTAKKSAKKAASTSSSSGSTAASTPTEEG